ncbi:MAG: TldD/PmbA family protein [Oscillospiraceae bacterium]|nr:TldD/PmbA family protein [Oscillospiraceae bacterium]
MITKEVCCRVLGRAMASGGDFAELFAERSAGHTIHMIDRKVDAANDAITAGAAVRVYKGLRSVMATTVDTSEAGLLRCAQQAADALGQSDAPIDIVLKERVFGDIHPVRIVPSSVSNGEKVEILKDAYFAAMDYHEAVRQVSASLGDTDRQILIANTEGLYTTDRQIRTRIALSAVAQIGSESQTGTFNPGSRMGLEMFETVDPKSVGIRAAKQAVTMAGAGYCPAGVMPVAIAGGFGGVIFHEACAHSLEVTFVAYGRSQFAGKLGQQIANPKVTAIDDGTIPNGWGSVNIDDEGHPSQRNVLIEKGILKSYMIDRMGGRRLGMTPTGNSRRQSYAYTPTSRMTNTFIAPGEDADEDIIGSIDYGLYAKEMGGGSVNTVTGEFNFAVDEGYIIRNGKICEPVRGACLVGEGRKILMDIDMVGKGLEMGQGMCGSSSGAIPTSVGQPLIRVSSITVGGR